MKYFFQLIKMSFHDAKEYVINFFGEILMLPFSLLVISLFWTSILKASPKILVQLNTDVTSVVFYYIVVSCVQYALSPFWYLNYPIYKDIISGKMAIYMARPIDYMTYTGFRYIGEFVTRIAITGLCLVMISLFVPGIRINGIDILFFLLVLAEIIMIVFCMQFLIASIAFKTEAIFGIRDLLYEVMYFLGGLIVPLDFLPASLRKVTDVLPFKYLYDYPAEVLLHGATSNLCMEQIFMCLWILILFVASRVIFTTSQRNFTANGG